MSLRSETDRYLGIQMLMINIDPKTYQIQASFQSLHLQSSVFQQSRNTDVRGILWQLVFKSWV